MDIKIPKESRQPSKAIRLREKAREIQWKAECLLKEADLLIAEAEALETGYKNESGTQSVRQAVARVIKQTGKHS